MRFVVHVGLFGKMKSFYECNVRKSEVTIFSQNKGIILEFILQLW